VLPHCVLIDGILSIVIPIYLNNPSKSPPPQLNITHTNNEEEAYQLWIDVIQKELQDFDFNRSIKPCSKEKIYIT
jgi:hypothetical protein